MSIPKPACLQAQAFLKNGRRRPENKYSPRDCPRYYVPEHVVKSLFTAKPGGVTLEDIYNCNCSDCVADGGPQAARRAKGFDVKELKGDYAIIYAVLIFSQRPGLIVLFQRKTKFLKGTQYLGESDLKFLEAEVADAKGVMEDILENQYMFLVRTLEPRVEITEILSLELLPIKEDKETRGQGAFGEVRCFEFLDDDYRAKDFKEEGKEITRFARKIFQADDKAAAIKEWTNYQVMKASDEHARHKHLMPALGAFTHGDIFFILQEEAEMALHEYLNGKPLPGQNPKFDSFELWKQVAGICEALSILHTVNERNNTFAYHRDLKPANILIHKRVLRLADFGLLHWQDVRATADRSSVGTPHGLNTGYYAAPVRNTGYRRIDDIWSLAAIMSELATFDMQGNRGLEKYRKDRVIDADRRSNDTQKFWLEDSKGNKNVKIAVIKQHEELEHCAKSGHSSLYQRDLNDFQKRFYTEEFFTLLDSMFRNKRKSQSSSLQVPEDQSTDIPRALEISDKIKALLETTSMPHSPITALPNIWEYTRAGKLRNDSGDPDCRFEAYAGDPPIKCGLLVSTDSRHTVVTVRQYTCELVDDSSHWNTDSIQIMCNATTVFKASYVPKDGIYSVLINPVVPPQNNRFGFRNLKDLLRFQSAITGRYPFDFKCYNLPEMLLTKKYKIMFKQDKMQKENSALHVQLWSLGPPQPRQAGGLWSQLEEHSWPRPPIFHIAVQSPTAIYLIKVKDALPRIDDTQANSDVLSFISPEVMCHEVDGIPTSQEEPAESYKYWSSASMKFETAAARKEFVDNIILALKIWKDERFYLDKIDREGLLEPVEWLEEA